MNKIKENVDIEYNANSNLINNLYKYKAIFSCAFLRNSKMYV